MHLTDHDRMETILTYRRPNNPRPSLLQTSDTFSLAPMDFVLAGDTVEDIQTGTSEIVSVDNFYGFLIGRPVEDAKQLPAVSDVRRPR